ncbi:hypothetical protein OQA88_13426 [Cercophora sp. LCS_1]
MTALYYSRSLPLLLFCLTGIVQGYSQSPPVFSIPPSSVNYVSFPSTRGTLDVLWGSLFTILICAWSVQYPNLPEQSGKRSRGRPGNISWVLKRLCNSLCLLLVAIITPEAIIATAVCDALVTKADFKKLQQFKDQDEVTWTLSHTHFANMGGFVLRVAPKEEDQPNALPHNNPYHLTAANLHLLRRLRLIEKLPHITEDELSEKSKTDTLLKAIAIAQVLWTIVAMIARATAGLTVSLVEIDVLPFVALTAVISWTCRKTSQPV